MKDTDREQTFHNVDSIAGLSRELVSFSAFHLVGDLQNRTFTELKEHCHENSAQSYEKNILEVMKRTSMVMKPTKIMKGTLIVAIDYNEPGAQYGDNIATQTLFPVFPFHSPFVWTKSSFFLREVRNNARRLSLARRT